MRAEPHIAYLAAGSAIHTIRWVNAIAERGMRVTLLTMHAPTEPLHRGVDVVLLGFPAPAGYLLNAPAVRRWLGRHQPDLLHVHYASGYGTLGRFAGFRPSLLSVWGSDIYEFPARSVFHRIWMRRILRGYDHLASTSHDMARRASELAGRSDINVTPFGIDTGWFSPHRGERIEGKIIIGTVKTLAPTYGTDLLLTAFAQLLESSELAAQRAELWLVGGGNDQPYRCMAEELGIGDRVRFVGPVSHDEVPRWLNQFDVYVALSRSESFGVAVLEASACELPVVVSDVGGLPEVVVDGKTGLVVPSEDVAAAADAFVRLCEDADFRRRLGTAGREFVKSVYDWNATVDRMVDLYSQCIESGRGEDQTGAVSVSGGTISPSP